MSTGNRTSLNLRHWKAAPLLAAALVLVASAYATQSAFHHWSAGQLKGYSTSLAPKMNEKKVASETIGKFGNHSLMIAHREGDGEAELHEKQADVFIVQSGKAVLVLGGEMVEAKTSAPGELRGPSIKGGEKREIAAGDIVHIPARLPHQLLIKSGEKFDYAVVKVDTP